MNTDDLITAMVADRRMAPPPATILWRYLTLPCLLAAILLLATAGVRADLADVALTPRVAFKLLLSLALVLTAAGTVVRLARPGAGVGGWTTALLAVLLALALGVGVD